jgi:hypothetical protein
MKNYWAICLVLILEELIYQVYENEKIIRLLECGHIMNKLNLWLFYLRRMDAA